MAPATTESLPVAPHELSAQFKSLFPDGIKTSGQHPPLYDQLQPYEQFPKEISGATVWKKEDYSDNPERWVHHFSEEEISELSDAADEFLASRTPLTGISKVRNPQLVENHVSLNYSGKF